MTTGRAIDHVVLAVRDLARTAADYERLGFTLTPRASHEDRMGTSNRLAQFEGSNFLELLEVDRPGKLQPHDFESTPRFFSFGDHNRLMTAERDGLSMLVFQTEDARSDLRRFEAAGLETFPPFSFERQAGLPDGSSVTVSFSLGFVRSPHMPRIAFFVCENRAQHVFWKPEYQRHSNGARGIRAVYLASAALERDAAFIQAMFGGEVATMSGGLRVACGPKQEVRVLTPEAIADRHQGIDREIGTAGPYLSGVALEGEGAAPAIPASEGCGMFIEWETP